MLSVIMLDVTFFCYAECNGATTLSLTILSIMTLSITASVTQHKQYMFTIVMLCAVILSVLTLSATCHSVGYIDNFYCLKLPSLILPYSGRLRHELDLK